MRKLIDEEMIRDIELGITKLRYKIRSYEEKKKRETENIIETEGRKKIKLDRETEEKDIEEKLDLAKERQFYDPVAKKFDYSKKRTTDLTENTKVFLPKLVGPKWESELEVIRNALISEYKEYKDELHAKKKKEIGESYKEEKNQEWDNLTAMEKRGLSKLKKRISKGDIVLVQTEKSGKITIMDKEKYVAMGKKESRGDKIIGRPELLKIEKDINDHMRMLCKVANAGESHGHLERIINSKITNSETCAPKYYIFKDHKEKESWRPVVSGCTSNTLGISNFLSDIVESVCTAVKDPYEVISSEDLLYRVEKFNKEIEKERAEKLSEGLDYDWRKDWMLIGSDVSALFPSLTRDRTAKAVRRQTEKS